jgi:hypothetical protein
MSIMPISPSVAEYLAYVSAPLIMNGTVSVFIELATNVLIRSLPIPYCIDDCICKFRIAAQGNMYTVTRHSGELSGIRGEEEVG